MSRPTPPIPVIRLAALLNDDGQAHADLAASIGRACQESGFFYIVGHGIPDTTVQRAFDVSRQLFALPATSKAELDIQRSPYMRGYFSYGADKSDGVHGDVKEGFDLAADLPADDPYVASKVPFYGPNVWPRQIPEFRATMMEYHSRVLELGLRLLRFFAISLGVPEDFFQGKFDKPMAQIRMLRYPPHVGTTGKHIGAGEHTDFGWITMIAQDRISGLEIQAASGEWVPVPFMDSSFVVNVGDLMSRWTNDRYPATMHRVVNRSDRDRYSIAFFMDPDYHTCVECLDSCRDVDTPSRYPPIVVGDYMNQRFYDTTTFRSLGAAKEVPSLEELSR